jgi:hypothetical protein
MNKEITIEKWISFQDAFEKYPDAPIMLNGGFFGLNVLGSGDLFGERWSGPKGRQFGQRWEDFLKVAKPEARPYYEAIRKEIVANKIRWTGQEHQGGNEGCPVFSDGTVCAVSLRAWGDLMAVIWSTEEDKDYCYMDFYW